MSITPLLLMNNVTGYLCRRETLLKKGKSDIACCTALDTAMYFALVMNIAIVFYLLVDYKTSSLPT